jgi:hypothetical protein
VCKSTRFVSGWSGPRDWPLDIQSLARLGAEGLGDQEHKRLDCLEPEPLFIIYGIGYIYLERQVNPITVVNYTIAIALLGFPVRFNPSKLIAFSTSLLLMRTPACIRDGSIKP